LAAGLAFGLALSGTAAVPGAVAQDEGAILANDIKAIVNGILADVFPVAGVAVVGIDDDSGITGGDVRVGVRGGGISIGTASLAGG
jgi:hypothetical protein